MRWVLTPPVAGGDRQKRKITAITRVAVLEHEDQNPPT